MVFQMVSMVLDMVAGLIAGTCLLRFLMQWQRISFHQPLGQFVFAVTDWLLLPLRRVVPPWSAWDLSSLVGAFLIKLVQYTLLWLVAGGQGALALLTMAGAPLEATEIHRRHQGRGYHWILCVGCTQR